MIDMINPSIFMPRTASFSSPKLKYIFTMGRASYIIFTPNATAITPMANRNLFIFTSSFIIFISVSVLLDTVTRVPTFFTISSIPYGHGAPCPYSYFPTHSEIFSKTSGYCFFRLIGLKSLPTHACIVLPVLIGFSMPCLNT